MSKSTKFTNVFKANDCNELILILEKRESPEKILLKTKL